MLKVARGYHLPKGVHKERREQFIWISKQSVLIARKMSLSTLIQALKGRRLLLPKPVLIARPALIPGFSWHLGQADMGRLK